MVDGLLQVCLCKIDRRNLSRYHNGQIQQPLLSVPLSTSHFLLLEIVESVGRLIYKGRKSFQAAHLTVVIIMDKSLIAINESQFPVRVYATFMVVSRSLWRII